MYMYNQLGLDNFALFVSRIVSLYSPLEAQIVMSRCVNPVHIENRHLVR